MTDADHNPSRDAASDDKFRQLLESTPDAMVITDQHGVIQFANRVAEQVFGYLPGELLGQEIELLMPERLRHGHRMHRQAYHARPHFRSMGAASEFLALRKDGSEFPAEISLGFARSDGELLIFAAIRDVTARNESRRALERNLETQKAIGAILHVSLEPLPHEKQLERILQETLSLEWIGLEPCGAIFAADKAQPGRMILKASIGLVEPPGAACWASNANVHRCLHNLAEQEIPPAGWKDCAREPDGVQFASNNRCCIPVLSNNQLLGAIHLYLRPDRPPNSEQRSFLASVADVVAGILTRERAELALRKSEERFQLAVHGTDAGIWDWNLVTNEVYYSPRWKSILGYEDHEIQSAYEEWEKRLHPEDSERIIATLRAYLDGEILDYDVEHRLRHKDGSYRWILVRGAAVRDAGGKAYRMAGSHLDITERKLSEASLREKEFQLMAAQKIQQRLLPDKPPDIPGLEAAGAYYPADFAAGDYYDYLAMPGQKLGVVIGDVSGHGFAPALLMASIHTLIGLLAETTDDVGEILTAADAYLAEETDDAHFVTLFLACIDPRARSLTYCGAGHLPAYVLDSAGELKATLSSQGVPLTVLPERPYVASEPVQLAAGDLLLLFTDGIIEAFSPDNKGFGVERLLEVARAKQQRPAQEIVDAIYASVREFTCRRTLIDDATLLAVKVC